MVEAEVEIDFSLSLLIWFFEMSAKKEKATETNDFISFTIRGPQSRKEKPNFHETPKASATTLIVLGRTKPAANASPRAVCQPNASSLSVLIFSGSPPSLAALVASAMPRGKEAAAAASAASGGKAPSATAAAAKAYTPATTEAKTLAPSTAPNLTSGDILPTALSPSI